MPIGIYKRTEKHKQNLSKNHKSKKPGFIHFSKKSGFTPPMLGKKHSIKTRLKMSLSAKGKKFSNETRKKMSERKKEMFSNFDNRKKLSNTIKNLYIKYPEYREKIRKANIGKRYSLETRLKKSGKNHPNWLGGISFEPYSIDWTDTLKRCIRERDKYICQMCGALQGDIAFDVHHIDYNKKNCNPNNLITLCHSCHAKTLYNKENWSKILKERIYNG